MTNETNSNIGFVTDTLAVLEKRIHKIPTAFDSQHKPVAFKHYELYADKETEMPIDHAMFFLIDGAFIVKDSTKTVLKPLASQEQATHISIPEGFVLAELSELTREALVLRCKVLPGSEHIHVKKTSVDEMISFLKSAQPKAKTAKEDFSQAELDKMLDE